MTTAALILAFASAHGIEAIANIDGNSAALFIETRTPILYADGSVAFYEDGVDMIEVSSLADARLALGY